VDRVTLITLPFDLTVLNTVEITVGILSGDVLILPCSRAK